MRLRRALRAWLAAAVLSLALVSGAHAAKPVTVSCGQTVTKDTKLANDLTNCPANGIIIGADNITLDLNGHTIDGDGDGFDSCETTCDAGVDNRAGHDGITIKDGAIREFVSGVDLVGAYRVRDLSTSHHAHGGVDVAESTDIAIKRVSSAADGLGVFVAVSSHVRIERNSVSDNEFSAIGLFGCDHVLVSRNSISRSGLSAIAILENSDHNRVERNSISDGSDGIFLDAGGDHNVVTGNSVSGSVYQGIFLGPGATHKCRERELVVWKQRWRGPRRGRPQPRQ